MNPSGPASGRVAEQQRRVLVVGAGAAGQRRRMAGRQQRLGVTLAADADDEQGLGGGDGCGLVVAEKRHGHRRCKTGWFHFTGGAGRDAAKRRSARVLVVEHW